MDVERSLRIAVRSAILPVSYLALKYLSITAMVQKLPAASWARSRLACEKEGAAVRVRAFPGDAEYSFERRSSQFE